jgi:hypothetical protein
MHFDPTITLGNVLQIVAGRHRGDRVTANSANGSRVLETQLEPLWGQFIERREAARHRGNDQ